MAPAPSVPRRRDAHAAYADSSTATASETAPSTSRSRASRTPTSRAVRWSCLRSLVEGNLVLMHCIIGRLLLPGGGLAVCEQRLALAQPAWRYSASLRPARTCCQRQCEEAARERAECEPRPAERLDDALPRRNAASGRARSQARRGADAAGTGHEQACAQLIVHGHQEEDTLLADRVGLPVCRRGSESYRDAR